MVRLSQSRMGMTVTVLTCRTSPCCLSTIRVVIGTLVHCTGVEKEVFSKNNYKNKDRNLFPSSKGQIVIAHWDFIASVVLLLLFFCKAESFFLSLFGNVCYTSSDF